MDRWALDGACATLKEILCALQRFGITLTAAGDGAEVSIRRAPCHSLVNQLGLARRPLQSGLCVAGPEPLRILKVPPLSCRWLQDRPPSAIVWFEWVDFLALGTPAQGAMAVDMAWVHEAAPHYAATLRRSIAGLNTRNRHFTRAGGMAVMQLGSPTQEDYWLQHQHPNRPVMLLLPRERNLWNQDSLKPTKMLQRM